MVESRAERVAGICRVAKEGLHARENMSGNSTNVIEENPVVTLAIGRLDSCNGIAEYFCRVAKHFRARLSPADILIGSLVRYPRTEERLAKLGAAANRLHICREVDEPAEGSARPSGFYRALLASCKAVRGRKALINSHSLDALAVSVLVARFFPHVHVVHTFHSSLDQRRIALLSNAVGRLLIRGNSRVRFIAISSEIQGAIVHDGGIPRDRVQRICHGVDTDIFRPPTAQERESTRKRFDVRDECCCLAMVGRLDPDKGFEELFAALGRIPAARERFRVICVGSGDIGWVQQRAAEHGLADILRMAGEGDPIPALWASDQFVLPSRHEGFAIVCVEAMACGLPVVRTDTGGALDQIDMGRNGYVIPTGDIAALASKIAALADDSELRRQMGCAARTRAVDHFHTERLLEETRAFFNIPRNC